VLENWFWRSSEPIDSRFYFLVFAMITLPSKVSRGDELTAAWANKVVDTLASLRPMAGEGTRVSQTPGGFIVSSNVPFQKKPFLPFDMILSVSGGDDQVSLVPGICGGFLPTNLNTPVTIDLSSTVYVFLDVVASLGQITSVTINANNSPFSGQTPNAGHPPSSFKIPVGIIMVSGGNVTASYNLLAKNWVSPVGSVTFSVGQTNYYVWTW
jgi:hypothetical protein